MQDDERRPAAELREALARAVASYIGGELRPVDRAYGAGWIISIPGSASEIAVSRPGYAEERRARVAVIPPRSTVTGYGYFYETERALRDEGATLAVTVSLDRPIEVQIRDVRRRLLDPARVALGRVDARIEGDESDEHRAAALAEELGALLGVDAAEIRRRHGSCQGLPSLFWCDLGEHGSAKVEVRRGSDPARRVSLELHTDERTALAIVRALASVAGSE